MNLKRCREYLMGFCKKIIVHIGFIVSLINYSYAQPVEIRTFHDENNSIVKEIYFIDDSTSAQLIGQYKSYFINGTLDKEGFYKNNIPDSLWTYYYESGQPKMKGMLKDGASHGLWEYYFENGKISMAGMIIDSKREDTWRYYYENGDLKSQGDYNESKKDGIWNYFYEEGELKAQTFYNGERGNYKEFYATGSIKSEGITIGGQSDSTWTYYHENGKVSAIGDYDLGKRTGSWIYYHENESVSGEGKYASGKKEGSWIYYHENGEVSSEGAVREGKREGYWKIFSENGALSADGVFEQDTGKYTEYYESGKIKAEGNLRDGKNHGLWNFYYEDGSKEGECDYNNGEGEYIAYYKKGGMKMKGYVKDGANVGLWELYNGDGTLAGYYRPYYEDNKPIYKIVDKKKPQRGNSIKPAYKFKSYKSRYFDPVINEYKGSIVATNPLAPIIGQLPISYEYYIEERLGYEVLATILRDPFFTSDENVELNTVYDRGFNIAVKQKYYHPEGILGMFYFGHEVRVTSLNHNANVIDSVSVPPEMLKINSHETKFEYALFVGDRWMQLYGERSNSGSIGITIDAFIGFGFGYRLYQKKYPNNPAYDQVFRDVKDDKFVISPRIGINLGIVF